MMAKQYLKGNITTVDSGGSNGFNTKRVQDIGFDFFLLKPTEEACKIASKKVLRILQSNQQIMRVK